MQHCNMRAAFFQ